MRFLPKKHYPKRVLNENVVYISSRLFDSFYSELDRINLFYPIVAQIHRYHQNLGQKKAIRNLPILLIIFFTLGAEIIFFLQRLFEGNGYLDLDFLILLIIFLFVYAILSSLSTLSRLMSFDFYALTFSLTYINTCAKVWSEYSLLSKLRQYFYWFIVLFHSTPPINLRISSLKRQIRMSKTKENRFLSSTIQLDLSKDTQYEAKFCQFCGRPLVLNAKFCNNCGSATSILNQQRFPSSAPLPEKLLNPPRCPNCQLPHSPKSNQCAFCDILLRKRFFYSELCLDTWISLLSFCFAGMIVYHLYLRTFLDGYAFSWIFGYLTIILLLVVYNFTFHRSKVAFKVSSFWVSIFLGSVNLLFFVISVYLFKYELQSSMFYAFFAPFLGWISGGIFLDYYWFKKKLILSSTPQKKTKNS
jgi:hypothetical protein